MAIQGAIQGGIASAAIADAASDTVLTRNRAGMVLSGEQLRVIEEAFKQTDDGDGALGPKELSNMWTRVFPNLDPITLRSITDQMYQDLDPNGDGSVSWIEILDYFTGKPSEWTEVDNMLQGDYMDPPRPPTRKEYLWQMIDMGNTYYDREYPTLDRLKLVVALFSNIAILMSIVGFLYESTLPPLTNMTAEQKTSRPGFIIESACMGFFTLEFLCRLGLSPDRKRFWFNFFTWVDILAILPFYVEILIVDDDSASALVVLRVLRLLRLLRMLKLGRRLESVQVLIIALGRSMYPLAVSMIGINSIAVVLFASCMFTAEKQDTYWDYGAHQWVRNNNSKFPDAGTAIAYQSIPVSMWWAWVTLTTVGYGDMSPVTGLGKTVASIAMLIGLVLMAFPLTLLATSFAEVMSELKVKKAARQRAQEFSAELDDATTAQSAEAACNKLDAALAGFGARDPLGGDDESKRPDRPGDAPRGSGEKLLRKRDSGDSGRVSGMSPAGDDSVLTDPVETRSPGFNAYMPAAAPAAVVAMGHPGVSPVVSPNDAVPAATGYRQDSAFHRRDGKPPLPQPQSSLMAGGGDRPPADDLILGRPARVGSARSTGNPLATRPLQLDARLGDLDRDVSTDSDRGRAGRTPKGGSRASNLSPSPAFSPANLTQGDLRLGRMFGELRDVSRQITQLGDVVSRQDATLSDLVRQFAALNAALLDGRCAPQLPAPGGLPPPVRAAAGAVAGPAEPDPRAPAAVVP